MFQGYGPLGRILFPLEIVFLALGIFRLGREDLFQIIREPRLRLEGLEAGPHLPGTSAPRCIDQTDGDLPGKMDFPSEVVARRGKLPGFGRRAWRPASLAIGQRIKRRFLRQFERIRQYLPSIRLPIQ